jgi:predicted esterase
MVAWIACTPAIIANADEPSKPFAGEWRTTISTVKLEQNGEDVTGSYGPGGRFSIKGTAKDNILTFDYQEGQAKGTARFVLDESRNAFTGTFQVQNGRSGLWNGWRPDPRARTDKSVSLAGLWLTDFGLAELVEDGTKVQGQYAARGNSTIEGKATGRQLDLQFQGFRGGHGWFDIAADGKTFTGAANIDGFPGWFGWRGRRASEFTRHAPLQPGKVVDGSTRALLTYAIRAPEPYQSSSARKWPTVLILHGSNMSGRNYVDTIATAWPDIAREFILLGINGETPSDLGSEPRFNYSYVNYVGRSTFKGFPGSDRESPALVSEAMAELKGVYPISHYLVGGHSQGGFLTYSLLMNFPESLAGAFPISCGVIFQCEPDAYADEALRRAQRAVPLAIVHGKTDPTVDFAMGRYTATLFGESNWPAFRFFADESGAHMFARLPVHQAIRWLEVFSSRDPVTLFDFAATRSRQGGYRDALAALNRAHTLSLDDRQRQRADELEHAINAKAAVGAAKYLPLIHQAKDGSWIDGWLAFRDDFEFASAAREATAAFAELRQRHDGPAKKAFMEARQLFQQGKQDEGYGMYREIVQSYYASPLYRTVKRWLEDRK